MKATRRIVGILLSALLVLVVAAALILPQLIDPAMVRDRIGALVKEKTGRELVIAGDIGWSVFPWLGVEIADARLANAPGFGDLPFAQVTQVQARVKLLPLLRKEVEMSTVVLDGLAINLAKAKDGRTNWDDLTSAGAPSAKGGDKPPASVEQAPGPALAALAIGGVDIRNARLSWDDRAAGAQQTIEQLNLRLGAIRPDQPIDVTLEFIAKGGEPALQAAVALSGKVAPTQAFKHIAGRDLDLNIAATGAGLPNGRLDARLAAQLDYAVAAGSFELKDVVLNALELTLRGQMQGAGIGGSAPRYSGALRLDRGSPRKLLQALGQAAPTSSDDSVLNKLEAGFEFQATSTAVQLSKLNLLLDDSTLTGTLGLKNFAKPAIDFDLAVDALDLDRYLPVPSPETAEDAEADAAGSASAAAANTAPHAQAKPPAAQAQGKKAPGLFPVQTLRALNLNGVLKIGALKAYQLRSSDVSITVTAKDGLVRVYPARANMYQGTYSGNIGVDVRGKQPRLTLDEKVTGVQAEPLLKDMLGEARVTGKADVALKLTAVGNRPPAIRKTLNGDASFAFTDGVIRGMDVLGEIRKAYALLRGKPQAAGVSNQTGFSAITGTATVTNGLVNNPDLVGKSPLMQVAGAGTAHLVTQQLDYRINATLVDSLEGKGELTGRPIPVHITGTFAQPKVGVDLEQVLKQEVKKKLEKKLQDTLQDKLKGDGLKGLFGR